MKKNVGVFLSALAALALAGCNKDKGTDAPGVDWTKVITDPDIQGFVLAGPSQTSVGENALDWSYKETSALHAASLNDVKAVSESLANELSTKNLKGLYILGDVRVGKEKANYDKYGYKPDGTLVKADGALTIKMCQYSYDEETEETSISTWMPSPEAYCMSLTPDTYQEQIHSEVKDINGLDHNSDVIVLGGSAVYTAVVAHFGEQVAAHDGKMVRYGLGLVKTGELDIEEKLAAEPYTPTMTTIESLGIMGSFNGWTEEVALVKNASGVYEGSITVEANAEFKVRANGDWIGFDWGYGALTTQPAVTDFVDASGNIKALKAGTVNISIKVPEQVSPISKDAISFTVAYAAE